MRLAILLAGVALAQAVGAQVAVAQVVQGPQDPAPVVVPQPGPEAEALALALARTGTLASLLPLIAAKETEELIAAHPEWSAAERERLRTIAQATYAAGRDRLFVAMAHEYARRLTLAELRDLVAVARLPVSARLRAAQPAAIAGTIQALGGMDFKGDTMAAFCREGGTGCPRP